MALVWREEMSTGLDWQDEQHKRIFARIDQLLEAMKHNKGDSVVKELIEFLGEYSTQHFKDEEDYMLAHGCTTCELHKKCHSEFIVHWLELKKLYETQGASTLVVMKLQGWLRDWLIKHIMDVDKLMVKTCAV